MNGTDDCGFVGFLLVKHFSKTEVSDFQGALLEKYVLRLDISVDDSLFL